MPSYGSKVRVLRNRWPRVLVVGALGVVLVLSAVGLSRQNGHSVAKLRSWNPHVRCKAVRTTIGTILGHQVSALGGATEAGGAFQPHLAGARDKRLLNPPCALRGVPTFVEID